MAYHVKKGDKVTIIAGDHKGSTGTVLKVDVEKGFVLIQGRNLVKKHVRPSQRNPQGGRINVEQPIHISNVQPHVEVGGKDRGTRVRFEVGEDGTKRRVSVRDGKVLSVVKKARK